MKLINGLKIRTECDMNEKIFPTILIILDVCAAAPYAFQGDWRKAVYWLAAAVLTTVVTY